MARLINCNIQDFLTEYSNRKMFVIGVGRIFEKFFQYFGLSDNVVFAVDNDKNKQGRVLFLDGKKIEIKSIDEMVSSFDGSQIILITNLSALIPIMEQLDREPKLRNVECFHASMMMDKCTKQDIKLLNGKQCIPKIIHYCWFGDNPIPDEYQQCIKSWKEHCPDYEFVKWDESNYDYKKNRYMREAYESKQWGFVPDFARLDIVYEHGGLYFDTDIEIIKSFDDLLSEQAFFGFHNYIEISPGLGFGAKKRHPFIKELRDVYDDKCFIKEDGSIDNRTCIAYSQGVFKKHGFIFNNTLQRIDDVTVFPTEVFDPTGALGISNLYSEYTHSFNHSARSWDTAENHENYNRIKRGDWRKYVR